MIRSSTSACNYLIPEGRPTLDPLILTRSVPQPFFTILDDAGGMDADPETFEKIFLGHVPIMLRSTYCILKDSNDRELTDLGECPYDQVRIGLLTL